MHEVRGGGKEGDGLVLYCVRKGLGLLVDIGTRVSLILANSDSGR